MPVLPGPFARQRVGDNLRTARFLLSNLPGPSQEIRVKGRKVIELIGYVPPTFDQTLAILIYSYNGKFRFSVTLDSSVQGVSADEIKTVLEEEFDKTYTLVKLE